MLEHYGDELELAEFFRSEYKFSLLNILCKEHLILEREPNTQQPKAKNHHKRTQQRSKLSILQQTANSTKQKRKSFPQRDFDCLQLTSTIGRFQYRTRETTLSQQNHNGNCAQIDPHNL
jgi:hypothetical protein